MRRRGRRPLRTQVMVLIIETVGVPAFESPDPVTLPVIEATLVTQFEYGDGCVR